jgi:hypothetical protein
VQVESQDVRETPWVTAEPFAAWVDPHCSAMLGFAVRLTSTVKSTSRRPHSIARPAGHGDHYLIIDDDLDQRLHRAAA